MRLIVETIKCMCDKKRGGSSVTLASECEQAAVLLLWLLFGYTDKRS